MKKLLIILLLGFSACCRTEDLLDKDKVITSYTEVIDTPKVKIPLEYNGLYDATEVYSYDGMTYVTIYGTGCMNTINYTKDSLEVLVLKKQLQ